MVRGNAGFASVFVVAGVLSGVACTRQVQVVTPSRTAVATVMARQTRNAIDAGEGDLQLRALRQRLAANANDLEARMLLARQYARRGAPDLALEHYRFAAGQFPDAPAVALALAKALREMDQPAEALKSAGEFLAKHPGGSWELLSFQGILEDERGRFGAAETSYRAALAVEERRSSLHNNLGYNLLLQGKPEEAASEFRRAIALDPRSAIAHNNLGTALASLARPASGEALAEWQRSGDPAAAHNNLAAVLMEQGRYADAHGELDLALGFRRDFPAAIANLKLLAQMDGRAPTLPPQPVNFWKRVASFVVGEEPPKGSVSHADGASTER